MSKPKRRWIVLVAFAAGATLFLNVLHGSDDPRARIQEARRVFDAVPRAKRFQEFPGVRHEPAAVRFCEKWSAAVRQFLQGVENKPSAGNAGPEAVLKTEDHLAGMPELGRAPSV